MASIIVLVIIAALVAYQFLKGSFLKACVTFMAALSAGIIAFAWFEQLADLLIKQEMLIDWAQSLCLVVLFIAAFAVLQVIATTLTREHVDFGEKAERVGRIIFGILQGLVISGLLLTAADLAPMSGGFPYQRFDASKPDPQKPHKALLNPDGILARFFAITSSGSLRGSQSFAVLHADFIDELFLNRLLFDKTIPVRANPGSIILPSKAAAWPAPDNLKDSKGAPLASRTGYELIMVRIGLTNAIMKAGGTFNPGQLRLICKQKGGKQPLQGSAVDVYPAGYLSSADQIQSKGPDDQIKIQPQDIKDKAAWIDFAFYVPNVPIVYEPVALGFRANLIAEVPPLVSGEQVPKPAPFISSTACATVSAKVAPATSSVKIYGIELASETKLLEGTTLKVSDRAGWTALQTEQSIMPARFEQEKITCTRAELKSRSSAEPNQPSQKQKESRLGQMLKPAAGYSLISLKCNNPAVGSAIPGEQLPSLIDSISGEHRPCGILAGGKVDDSTVFELDYCSIAGEITIAEDGSVAVPFPDSIWLTEQAKSILEFHAIYMVKTNTIIVSVLPAGAQTGAALENTEGFLAR